MLKIKIQFMLIHLNLKKKMKKKVFITSLECSELLSINFIFFDEYQIHPRIRTTPSYPSFSLKKKNITLEDLFSIIFQLLTLSSLKLLKIKMLKVPSTYLLHTNAHKLQSTHIEFEALQIDIFLRFLRFPNVFKHS